MAKVSILQGICLKSAPFVGLMLFCLQFIAVHADDRMGQSIIDYDYLNINAYVSYSEDFNNTLSINDILLSEQWSKNPRGTTLNFGFVNYPVWVKFSSDLDKEIHLSRYLVIPYPLLQNVDLYLVNASQKVVWKRSLQNAGQNLQPIESHHINFQLPSTVDQNSTFYLKVSSSTSLQIPLEIWRHDNLISQQNQETLLWGLYFGLMLALIFYNSFLYTSMRDSAYLYYVFTLISVMSMMLAISGFGNRYLWGDPDIAILVLPVSASMASFWLLYFCMRFLKPENIHRGIRAAIRFLAIVSLFTTFYVMYVPEKGALTAGVIGSGTIGLVLLAGLSSLASGQVIARFFVFATASFGLGAFLYLANVFGLAPSSRITNHSIQAGSVLEALLFSFALAHRFKEERRQKLIAMEKMELAQRTILQVQNQALEQALHDPVSKKPNESLLSNRVNEIVESRNKIDNFALVLVSFPQIKQIASSMGRRLSEEVFQSVIETLEKELSLESQAIAIEFSSNSYVAVLDFGSLVFLCHKGESYKSVNEFVDRFLRLYDSALKVGETSIQLDAYSGISVYPNHGDRADLLIQHASAARDFGLRTQEKLSVYSSEIDTFGRRRLALVAGLTQAIKDKELKLYLQPQFDCKNLQLSGAEVLLRWNSEQFGFVSPEEFIEVAEEAGLMSHITRYLIDEAFMVLKDLCNTGLQIKLSINLSTQNLTEPNFVPQVVAKAEDHKINLSDVVFEVTETYMSEDMDTVVKTLDQLGSAGCSISLDDYGTGYSSLMYLSQLPVNELKIDKSFVSQAERSESNYRIVENTVKLARALQIETVAEGVENEQTLNALIQLGCHRVQGYHFAKPMPVSQFHEWLERREAC